MPSVPLDHDLYLVATPIGNLQDMSPRAVEVLQGVDLIAAEDTRHTRKLCAHWNISTDIQSFHEHNERDKAPGLVAAMKCGRRVALVCDAGTPSISDPGFPLVRLAIKESLKVAAVPGPSSLLAALVVSGLPTDRFHFEGFLSNKGATRRRRLKELSEYSHTLVFFESPHRIVKALIDAAEILGDRPASLSRELTKKFEETLHGTLPELLDHVQTKAPKGELVLVISGAKK
ncbi:MAG: 16S rRNA (cytidine(1402)-2'-O)-methyltransferase [Candidatus Omnitrophica bacterium]|nr:16S rRNA (cytidine(1402)-2'-O)-methyltransferase [Candidatus Omnitrophota bacterium]